MKTESCRKCGTEFDVKQNCSICNSVTQFYCKKCNTTTDVKVHLDCYQSSFEKEVKKITQAISNA